MKWTLDSLQQLAPDDATIQRAIALAVLRKWECLGIQNTVIWGVAKGRGSTNYRCMFVWDQLKFSCSCSNKTQPCKHSLALATLYLERLEAFEQPAKKPDWVVENMKILRIPDKPESEAELVAQAAKNKAVKVRNRNQRIEQMAAGFEDLENWLNDVIRQGLANMPQQSEQFWEDIAARMVDVKLGSLGRKFRQLAHIQEQQLDWPEEMLSELATIYLLAQSFKQYDTLPEKLQQELLLQAGVTIRREDLLKEEGMKDRWQLIARKEGMEDNLKMRQIWFQGQQSGRIAMLLEFVHHTMNFKDHWPDYSTLDATFVFYPSTFPIRALIKTYDRISEPFSPPKGYESLSEMLQAYTDALREQVWLNNFPCYLSALELVFDKEEPVLIDLQKNKLPIQLTAASGWKILALSAGKKIGLFGEWNGQQFFALSCWQGDRLIYL